MIFQRRWLVLFFVGTAFFLASGWLLWLRWLGLMWPLLLIGLAVLDWSRLPKPSSFEVLREVEERLALDKPVPVTITVRNYGTRPLHLTLTDSPPEALQTDLPNRPFDLYIPPSSRQTVTYHLIPNRRGDYAFANMVVHCWGQLGLVGQVLSVPAVQVVKVYPGLRELAEFNLAAQRRQLQQIGVRHARRYGVGSEFESLRDYVPDDDIRHVDWKATARRGHLVTRQYELERSQNIVLLLDIGRTMWGELEGKAKIDYAIQAALLLAYVASFFDDRVGLLVFSNRIHTFLPPRRGRHQSYAVLEALHNVHANLEEPDYRGAFHFLESQWPRRSLLICFTDLWDAVSAHHVIASLAAQQPRYLPVAVTLLNSTWVRAREQEPVSTEAIFQKVAAIEALKQREHALRLLTQKGVLVVDSMAENLSVELVNRYLAIKERMLL